MSSVLCVCSRGRGSLSLDALGQRSPTCGKDQLIVNVFLTLDKTVLIPPVQEKRGPPSKISWGGRGMGVGPSFLTSPSCLVFSS